MRKILFLMLASVLLAGCNKIMYTESVYIVDYREYIKDGFIISPTVTGFNYQPISNLEVVFSAGELRKDEKGDNLQPVVPYKGYTGKTKKYAPTSKRMMDKIVNEAKQLGANGLIDFKTAYNPKNGTWSASGIAVVIK